MKKILGIIVSIFIASSVFAGYLDSVMPVDDVHLSSGFGPRLKVSEGYRYDFHKGYDFVGNTGDSVYAIDNAEVFRVYYEGEDGSPYPNGGTVIILRHRLDSSYSLAGEEHEKLYSLYMHLDSVNSELIDIEDVKDGYPYPRVNRGNKIGKIGTSGTTDFEHLHFETRVGSTCSLNSSCSKGYDPHVNPISFLPFDRTSNNLSYRVIWRWPLVVEVYGDNLEMDFEGLKVQSRGKTRVVNFSTREGINPNNDDRECNNIAIYPDEFTSRSDRYKTTFVFKDIYGRANISMIEAK